MWYNNNSNNLNNNNNNNNNNDGNSNSNNSNNNNFFTAPMQTPFQSAPLDMFLECFYTNRKQIINERLCYIRSLSIQKLQLILIEKWNLYENVIVVGVNWVSYVYT